MSDRPTQETDALWHSLNTGKNQPSWWVVAEKMRDLASRLEARARFFEHGFHTHSAGALEYMIERDEARRERDEAREDAAKWESSSDAMERAGAEQARRADENREWALRAERERDEAREEWGKASMDAAQLLSEKTKVMAERDEARAERDLARKEINHYREKNDLLPISWDV